MLPGCCARQNGAVKPVFYRVAALIWSSRQFLILATGRVPGPAKQGFFPLL
jgi:hypothetical protein